MQNTVLQRALTKVSRWLPPTSIIFTRVLGNQLSGLVAHVRLSRHDRVDIVPIIRGPLLNLIGSEAFYRTLLHHSVPPKGSCSDVLVMTLHEEAKREPTKPDSS